MNLEFMSPQVELPGNVSRLHTSSSVPLDKPLKEKTTGSRVYVQVGGGSRKGERRKGGVAKGGHSAALSDKYQLKLNVVQYRRCYAQYRRF